MAVVGDTVGEGTGCKVGASDIIGYSRVGLVVGWLVGLPEGCPVGAVADPNKP